VAGVEGGAGVPIDRGSALAALGVDDVGYLGGEGGEEESWRRYPEGWIRLEVELGRRATGGDELRGVFLGNILPAGASVGWLGRGPSPIWRNRRAGPTFGHWRRVPAPGFYDDVVWAWIVHGNRQLTVVIETAGTFVGFSAPHFPLEAFFATAEVPPQGSLSFLSSIPAIGTKFHAARDLGPEESVTSPDSVSTLVVWLRSDEAGSASKSR
jgi:hypothetical protein